MSDPNKASMALPIIGLSIAVAWAAAAGAVFAAWWEWWTV